MAEVREPVCASYKFCSRQLSPPRVMAKPDTRPFIPNTTYFIGLQLLHKAPYTVSCIHRKKEKARETTHALERDLTNVSIKQLK